VLLGGGIGAGKSSVAELFVAAGFNLVEADRIGAAVLGPGTAATRVVASEWPDVVTDDVVDRSALARIVFSSQVELKRLESITHPAIRGEIERIVSSTSRDIVVEVPLTTLGLGGTWLKIAVVADEDTRIARAILRGGEPDDVRRRVDSQVSDGVWAEWADIVVQNSGSWTGTERQVVAVIEGLRG
jgi:dephospho-CoA kinase